MIDNLLLTLTLENGSQSSMREGDAAGTAREKIVSLEEENNMLKYKIELLLDMVRIRSVKLFLYSF